MSTIFKIEDNKRPNIYSNSKQPQSFMCFQTRGDNYSFSSNFELMSQMVEKYGIDNCEMNVDYSNSYYDSIDIDVIFRAYRLETQEEVDQRLEKVKQLSEKVKENEKVQKQKQLETERKEYERLKKKFEK